MLRTNLLLLLFWLSWVSALTAQQDPQYLSYIRHYKHIAIQEMTRTNIPASITLAQAILESGAGQSELAQMANNHFGIKCGNDWGGQIYFKKDDDYDLHHQLRPSCFRTYSTVEESFLDHSNYLTDPKQASRYGFLFKLDHADYRSWAYGLQQAGYATSLAYSEKLIQLIERYSLYEYDLIFPQLTDPIEQKFPPLITTTNKVPHTFASGFETALDVAIRVNIPLINLLTFNEKLVAGYVLPKGEKIYLAPKRKKFSGHLRFHELATNESIYDVAQRYGVKLDKLLARNRLSKGEDPQAGQLIKLNGSRVKKHSAAYPAVDAGFDDDHFEMKNQVEPPTLRPPTLIGSIRRPNTEEPSATPTRQFHVVQRGDTLWGIARKYNTSVETLTRLNNLNSKTIRRGMKLFF